VRFEPHSALVASESGLADIRCIAEQARQYLQPGGWLLLEHGYQQGAATGALLTQLGYGEVQTLADLGGQPRVTLGRWSGS
jgi:release factor glutamine methyltransferase